MANSRNPSSTILGESTLVRTTIDSPSPPHLSSVTSRQTIDVTSQVTPGQTTSQGSQVSPGFVNLRRASIAWLLVAPLVAIPLVVRVLVDRAAPALANVATTSLEHAFEWRPVHSAREAHAVVPEQAPQAIADTTSNTNTVTPRSPQPIAKQHRGIVVRADAVVRAVRSGGRPSSVPAPASGQRPAGLSLVGVSRFGTGLQDGDILTTVGGTAATSEGIVIGIVAGAIGQGAKVITGVVWRGDQRIDVAVEIPSPQAFAKPRRRKKSVHK